MKERREYIDKKFTSYAWSEMRRQLDREMPVDEGKNSRRLFGWWWLLVGLGLGAGASALWFYAKEKQPEHLQMSEPAAIVEPNAGSSFSQNERSKMEAVAETPAETVFSKTGQKTLTSSRKRATDFQKKNTSEATSPPVMVTVSTHAETQAPAQSFEAISQNAAPQEVFNEPLKNAPAVESSEMKTIGEMALIENLPTETTKIALPPALETAASPLNRPCSIHMALYGSGMTGSAGRGDGLAGGMLASFGREGAAFSLEAGVGYAYLRQPLSILVTENLGTTVFDPQANNVDYGFADLEEEAAKLQSSYYLETHDLGLHYLELPLTLVYRPLQRLRLHGGGSFDLMMVSAPGFAEGGILDKSRSNSEAVFDPSIAESSTGIQLSFFDAAAVGGLRYSFSSRIALDLQYRLGVVDVIKSNEKNDFNRMLRLSAIYQIR